jgi:phosphatidate cytidylyltransferase
VAFLAAPAAFRPVAAVPVRVGGPVLKRVASAVVLIPLFLWTVMGAPPWVFVALMIAVAAAGAWELAQMFARAGRAASAALAAAASAAATASFLLPGGPVPTLTAVVAVVLASAVWHPAGPAVESSLVSIMAAAYVGLLLGHALLLWKRPDGSGLILFLVGVTWAGETAAYAVGRLVGRHRLAPRVSPGKTVEGALGQLVASIGAAQLLAPLAPGLPGVHAVAAGALLGVVGQVGDLAESVIKRSLGSKDAGDLIPGHGGVLDRIDGLLFNTPALVYYVGVLGARP